MNWKDIPNMYKFGAAVVAVTFFVLTYHNQFITEAEAAETQKLVVDQLIMMRVDRKEDKKAILIREKSKAVELNKTADAEMLEQDIQTLRDQIKGLCDQVDGC